mmetsp:Transcript_27718/g.65834  ORF Transcript_27718/g.65834 Transcript_27718/m.65834 type:complete len:229 (-) Transcript_27718:2029-2715(-)
MRVAALEMVQLFEPLLCALAVADLLEDGCQGLLCCLGCRGAGGRRRRAARRGGWGCRRRSGSRRGGGMGRLRRGGGRLWRGRGLRGGRRQLPGPVLLGADGGRAALGQQRLARDRPGCHERLQVEVDVVVDDGHRGRVPRHNRDENLLHSVPFVLADLVEDSLHHAERLVVLRAPPPDLLCPELVEEVVHCKQNGADVELVDEVLEGLGELYQALDHEVHKLLLLSPG